MGKIKDLLNLSSWSGGINHNSSNSFVSSSDSNRDNFKELYENLFEPIMPLFQPGIVQGHFDDLVGQRMFIQILLLLICFFLLVFFLVFIFNIILILNKDRILGYFKNKYILLFLKLEFFYLCSFSRNLCSQAPSHEMWDGGKRSKSSKITLFIIPFLFY